MPANHLFPLSNENSDPIIFTVNGDWKFSIETPREEQIPGIVEIPPDNKPAVIDTQTNDQVTVTLDWVFADARRVGFGYTISGLPEIPENALLGGTIQMADENGAQFGSGYGAWILYAKILNDWDDYRYMEYHIARAVNEQLIQMNIDVTLDGTNGLDWNFIIGNINPLSPLLSQRIQCPS